MHLLARSCNMHTPLVVWLLQDLLQVPDLDGSGDMVQGEAVSIGRSVLAVFQRGQQTWSIAAAAQATKFPTRHL